MTKLKHYRVNIDFNASFDIRVRAKNKPEAKRKAWEKFLKKKSNRKYINFDVELEDWLQ
jgi:hypothetical protein